MKFAYLIEPPFNHRDADGSVTGCDVELARHVFGELGEDFEPVEAEFADLLPGLAAGRWQMTTGLFATEERQKIAQFSRPIWALPDGLLVPRGNPSGLTGYGSLAGGDLRVAVIRDQIQHHAVAASGLPADNMLIFDTYETAAHAVATGKADAYASVARAHLGYLAINPDLALDVITIPPDEKPPAKGTFGFALHDTGLREAVDKILIIYIGSPQHRAMMQGFGFTNAEVDLVAT